MQAKCKLHSLRGKVSIPPSKSMMQRVCAAALLHKGTTTIHNPGQSLDDVAALRVVQQLGADFRYINATTSLQIESNGLQPQVDTIQCGESGLAARLFIPIAAMADKAIIITGEGSLLNRPFNIYKEVLPQLGVQIETDGKLPITVKGPLQPKDVIVDGSLSSQFISGLLFAYAFSASSDVTITVKDLNSKPYVYLTLAILHLFGKNITHADYREFYIHPSAFRAVGDVVYEVEGDWSSAAALMVAAAIDGEVRFEGLSPHSLQADRFILNVLQQAGASIVVGDAHIAISSTETLVAFDCNATHCPDLFPVLAILAACCDGESSIAGLGRLAHKESDRAQSISAMLAQLQVPHKLDDDVLHIQGVAQFPTATIDAHNDHRIAMAAAIAALRADGKITIQGAEAVNKSYPRFYEDLRSLGAVVNFIS